MDIPQFKFHELLKRYGDRPIEVFSTPNNELENIYNQLLVNSNEYANRKFSLKEWVKSQSSPIETQHDGDTISISIYPIMEEIFAHSVFDTDLQASDTESIVEVLENDIIDSIISGQINDRYLVDVEEKLTILQEKYSVHKNPDKKVTQNRKQANLHPLLGVFVTIQNARIKEKYTDFLIAFKSDYEIKQMDLSNVENLLYTLNQEIVVIYQDVLDRLNNMTLEQILSPILDLSRYISSTEIMDQIAAHNYLVGLAFSNYMYALELLADFESSDLKKNRYLDGIIHRWDQLDQENLVFSHHITSLLNLQEMFSKRASQEIILSHKIEHRHKQKLISDQMFDLLAELLDLQSKSNIPTLSKSAVISKLNEFGTQMRNPLLFNEIFSVYIQEKTNEIRSNSMISIEELHSFIDMHLSVLDWLQLENPNNSFVQHRASYLGSIAKLQIPKLTFKRTILEGDTEGSLFDKYMSIGAKFKECEDMVLSDPILASQVNIMFTQCMIQASNAFVPDTDNQENDGDASLIAIPLNLAFSGMTEAAQYAMEYSDLKASQFKLRAEALRSIWAYKTNQLGFPSIKSDNRLQSLKEKFTGHTLDPSQTQNFNIQIEAIMDDLASIIDQSSDDEDTETKLRSIYRTMKNYTDFMDITSFPPSTSMETNLKLLKDKLATLKKSVDTNNSAVETVENLIKAIQQNEMFAENQLRFSNINSLEYENWVTLEDITNEDGYGFLMI